MTTVATTAQTTSVSVLPYAYWPMEQRVHYARTLAYAGDMIPSGLRGGSTDQTASRVFLVLETGAMLGLHPMAALQGIDVIKGTAAISPQTFTGLARGAGHKLRIRESGTIEGGDFRVDVVLIRADDSEEIPASFSMKDALRAELIDSYTPGADGDYVVKAKSDNWRHYPQDMCQWRALGRLARRGAADVTMGIGYFPEELEVAVNEDGYRRDMREFEDKLIEELQALDDKKDMAELWLREHPRADDGKRYPNDEWTDYVQTKFDAHLAGLTKDSRPPKEGAPGNTGIAAIDGPAQSAPEPTESADEPAVDVVTGEVGDSVVSDETAAFPEEVVVEQPFEGSEAEYAAYRAEVEAAANAATVPPEDEPAKPAGFNSSALKGK